MFYLRYRKDFEMASANEMFKERRLRTLVQRTNFDNQKIEFLENYISNLKEQIGIMKNHNGENAKKEEQAKN